jgi:hypothetical protein
MLRSALLLCCLVEAPADRRRLAAFNYMEVDKLTASDAAADDLFGWSVAIDGDTVVVGAYRKNSYTGAVYVFHTTDGGATYGQVAKLTASDAASGDYFAFSVAIDGDTVVVGASSAGTVGAVYVFRTTNGGATYGQVATLTAADAARHDSFGRSVAIAGDTVVVGAYRDDDGGWNSGSVYVYRTTDGGATYGQVAKLTADHAAWGDYFGTSVAIDGDTVVVGGRAPTWDGGSGWGFACVFRTTDGGATYDQVAKLTAADAAAGDTFGRSVAIAGDTIVIGAYEDDDAGTSSGSVYVFRTTDGGATYGQVVKLTAADAAADDYFGSSVAIDGERVVVGASGDDDGGSVYVFYANAPTSQPTTAQPTAQPTKQVDVLAPSEIALISLAGLIFFGVGCIVCIDRMCKSRPSAKTSPTVPEIETPPMLRTTSVLPMGTVEAVHAPDADAAPPILGEVVTHSTVLSVSN